MRVEKNTLSSGYVRPKYALLKSTVGSTGKAKTASADERIGSFIWVVVGGIIPVYRFIAESGFAWLPQLVIALLVLPLLLGRVRALPNAIVWVASAVLILLAGAVSGTSSDVSASLRTAVGLAVLVGIAPFVLNYYFTASPSFARRIATAFLCVQSVSATAALAQVAGLSVLGAQANSGRANGLAGHPNVQGLMCVIALILVVAMFRLTRGARRAALLLFACVNLGALIATGSLSSLLSLGTAAVVLIIVYRAGVRSLLLGTLGLAATVVLFLAAGFDPGALLAPVNHRIDVVTGESVGVASLGIRQQTYAFAWDYIQSDPLIGVGMDPTNQGTFNGITVVHNYILHAWYQGGLAMFLAIVGISILVLARIIRALINGEKGPEAAIMAAVIVYALGSAFYDQQQYWLPLILAFVSSFHPVGIPAPVEKDRPRRLKAGIHIPKVA
ncbi:UNVERIFIED_CONTAM: O-antigen ligase [Jeotgalibacillus campisalis]